MKLSELISELQDIYDAEGDLPVCSFNDEFCVLDSLQGASLESFELSRSEQNFGSVNLNEGLDSGDSVVVIR